ncbi:MAG: NADP-dependent malic enzyme [Gammaproteobacteria bacterium]
MTDNLKESALRYHRSPAPGKLAVTPTKPLATQGDLALAYSPGVAAACDAIVESPDAAFDLTARGNLVGVISNGTAVLGLGSIGPAAAKPVMEGKAVLFKKFSGIDCFDVEIDETDPERFIEVVAALEPTFGGINLEDIKAPECFIIERRLRERMNIPVLHDDQHGTAIIVCAAILNGLRLVDKPLNEVNLVSSGAGAAALACLDLLVELGLVRENVTVTDIVGVVYDGRTEQMDEYKARYSRATPHRKLTDVIDNADVFLGLSAPNVLTKDMVRRMAPQPLILALANPDPEIMPEEARGARPDAIIATGRSDYPNQVNNVLCFPFIFRGALDVGATEINEAMKLACVKALADLAMAGPSDEVMRAYGGEPVPFGPDMIIPKPFDPRLIIELAPAVARAAMDSGVAMRPITDFAAYRERLTQFVFRSGLVMKPVFEVAKREPARLVFAEGEEPRVLQAAQQVIDEGIAMPVLVGRPSVIQMRLKRLGLRLQLGQDVELVNILKDRRFRQYWGTYHALVGRHGVTPEVAKAVVRSNPTAVAALMVQREEADAMICGTVGRFKDHLRYVDDIIGKREGVSDYSALTALILPSGTFFICDTHVTSDPTVDEIVHSTLLAAREVAEFGIQPRVALLSRSNFGSHDSPSSIKMRNAVAELQSVAPDLEVDGEMHADAALSQEIRALALPESKLRGSANLLVMPNVDAANITYNLLKVIGGGVTIGPILTGVARSAHIVTQSTSVRGLVNMSAVASARAQSVSPQWQHTDWQSSTPDLAKTFEGARAGVV